MNVNRIELGDIVPKKNDVNRKEEPAPSSCSIFEIARKKAKDKQQVKQSYPHFG